MTDLFENEQWKVTEWGLQSVVPGAPYEYNIEGSRLLETGGAGRGELYDWPIHMAEKTWIDIETFIEAFAHALEHHKGSYKGELDSELLEKSFLAARERDAKRS